MKRDKRYFIDARIKGAIGETLSYGLFKELGRPVARYGYENTVEPQMLLNGRIMPSRDPSLRKRPDLIILNVDENGSYHTTPIEVKTRQRLHPNIIQDNEFTRKYYPESIFLVVCNEEPYLMAQHTSRFNRLSDLKPFDSLFYVGDEKQSIFDCYKEAAEHWLGIAQ